MALIILGVACYLRACTETSFTYDHFPLQEQWGRSLGGNIQGISTADEEIILARTDRTLYALDLKTGNTLWHHHLAWQAIPEPAIAMNGIVVMADGKMVRALNQADGSTLWETPVSKPEAQIRSVSKNVVAVDIAGDIRIYDLMNGSLLWSEAACRNEIQSYIYEPNLYIPCYGIRALEISSGKEVWKIEHNKRIAKVTYDHGVMYYSPNQSTVVAFDLRKRTELWETSLQSRGYTQFKVIEDILFLTDSNQFCAFEKDKGNLLWCTKNMNPQNPAKLGDVAYIFDGYQKEISAIDISDGSRIGKLTLKKLGLFTVYKQLMVSTKDTLTGLSHLDF